MRSLRQALEDYLRVRRRLGFKLGSDQRLLEDFVGFLEQAGAARITSELAVMWAQLPVDAHPHRWGQRLSIVRVFARYVATLDPASEVPSVDLLPARRPRVAPYIYSPAEITAGATGIASLQSFDPLAYLAALFFFVAIVTLACSQPIYRAIHTNPSASLQYE